MFSEGMTPSVGAHPGSGCKAGRILSVPVEAHAAKELLKVPHSLTSLQEYIKALTSGLALARCGKYFFTEIFL